MFNPFLALYLQSPGRFRSFSVAGMVVCTFIAAEFSEGCCDEILTFIFNLV